MSSNKRRALKLMHPVLLHDEAPSSHNAPHDLASRHLHLRIHPRIIHPSDQDQPRKTELGKSVCCTLVRPVNPAMGRGSLQPRTRAAAAATSHSTGSEINRAQGTPTPASVALKPPGDAPHSVRSIRYCVTWEANAGTVSVMHVSPRLWEKFWNCPLWTESAC